MDDEKIKLLQGISLFRAASPKELKQLSQYTQEISVNAGDVLARKGEAGQQVFVILEGIAGVELPDGDVEIGPGEFFGELALLDQAPRMATVKAKSDMKLLVLSNQEFSSALDAVPTLARSVMKTLAHRLREAEEEHTH